MAINEQAKFDIGGSDAGTERGDANLPADDASSADVREISISDIAEMQDRLLRSEAESANVRTRAKRDVEDARNYAVQKFATDAVETVENMHRAMERMPPATRGEPESITGLRLGLVEIERGFIALLERNSVKRQDPVGDPFDPNLHQAMAEQETTEQPSGAVFKALSPIWTLNGRLLKPAMVVVAKSPPSHR